MIQFLIILVGLLFQLFVQAKDDGTSDRPRFTGIKPVVQLAKDFFVGLCAPANFCFSKRYKKANRTIGLELSQTDAVTDPLIGRLYRSVKLVNGDVRRENCPPHMRRIRLNTLCEAEK